MSSSSTLELPGTLAAMPLFLDATLPFPEVDLRGISSSTVAREHTTDLVFFGISVGGAGASVRDRREYVEVLGRIRFTGAETEVAVSSSEFSSGTARFLPLASLVGSLMVSGGSEGNVERRALRDVHGLSNEETARHRRVDAPLAYSRSIVRDFLPLPLQCGLSSAFRG